MFFKNGDSYEGDFRKNMKQGRGRYNFKSGTYWEGNFDDDKMNGEGDFIGKSGKKQRIKYEKGKLIK